MTAVNFSCCYCFYLPLFTQELPLRLERDLAMVAVVQDQEKHKIDPRYKSMNSQTVKH